MDVVETYVGTTEKRMYSESKPLAAGGEEIATDIYSKIKGDKYPLLERQFMSRTFKI